jgi:hypothetical protein
MSVLQGGLQPGPGWRWNRGFKSCDKSGSIYRYPRTIQETRANAALEADWPEVATRPKCRLRRLPTHLDELFRPRVCRVKRERRWAV